MSAIAMMLAAMFASAAWMGRVEAQTSDIAQTSGASAEAIASPDSSPDAQPQSWNWHAQNTDTVQGYPPFSAKYSGPNSLPTGGQIRETVAGDLFAGVRLWRGAEAHLDLLAWQGFGLHNTLGIDDFPNGQAYKAGTDYPRLNLAQLFIRQTIGLGGEQESVPDDDLTLAGRQDISRFTMTIGRFAAINIFDQNAYADDPNTQFMNWAFITNVAWDYPADALGYTTGVAFELNHPEWALRYGFFQIEGVANTWTAEDALFIKPGYQDITAGDGAIFKAWGMVAEMERRYTLDGRNGAIRLLSFANRAHSGSYLAALAVPGTDINDTREYRANYGFGLNWEQAISENAGLFSRLGWNYGRNQAWMFTDVNYTGSFGVSVNGASWNRSGDTFGLAGVMSGISRANQRFLNAGGTGILDGDGALSYGWEEVVETYYDWDIWKSVHFALDYQLVANPAFNRDRGPVNILGSRLHMEL
ncbi:MAG TPA: carbohydrate porin [Candidatus Binataceae bacterium]|nr:carbohydrate porin [Candidatus Binataceae bacterium]